MFGGTLLYSDYAIAHSSCIHVELTSGWSVGVVEGQAPGVDTVDTPGVSGADNSVLLNVLYSGQVADL